MRHDTNLRRIEAVGIVPSVRNEQVLLPAALDALHKATVQLPLEVECRTAGALDDCTDGSAVIARQWTQGGWIEVIQRRFRSVGAARRAWRAALLQAWDGLDPTSIWLCTTDADSQVPPECSEEQLVRHAAGADLWTRRVEIADWSSHQPSTMTGWTEREVAPIHGASMGFTTSAYLKAGGFPPSSAGRTASCIGPLSPREPMSTMTRT